MQSIVVVILWVREYNYGLLAVHFKYSKLKHEI